jgi:hypothetical protein
MEVEKMNVYQKLHQVMSNVKKVSQDEASKIPYKIVTWNTVHGAIKDALKKARLVLLPICTSQDEIGNKTIVKMTIQVVNIDKPTEVINIGEYPGYGIDSSDKGPGKAITYAFKNILMKLFFMEVGKDEESETTNPAAEYDPEQAKWQGYVQDQKNKIYATALKANINVDERITLIDEWDTNAANKDKIVSLKKYDTNFYANLINFKKHWSGKLKEAKKKQEVTNGNRPDRKAT